MAITMNVQPGELAITDWRTSGLLKPSVVKPIFATGSPANRSIMRAMGDLVW
jgi:hypothetical protein